MAYYRNSYLANSNQNGLADTNLKYKKKYGRLKNKIKALVFENGALCDQVALVQENILLVKEERKALLRKLLEYEGDIDPHPNQRRNSISPSTSYSDHVQPAKKSKRKANYDAQGRPNFPIRFGNLTVYSLGQIIADKPLYHAEEIYPIGYVSTRVYGSLRDPQKKCVYTCKITDGGNEPRFEIIADSDFDSPIIGSSPNYCHGILLQYINDAANMVNFSIYPKGGKFFGLTHPAILHLIQNLPGARECMNYKLSRYEQTMKSSESDDDDNDPSINFDKLQKCIISPHHTISEIKEEPPDDILDFTSH